MEGNEYPFDSEESSKELFNVIVELGNNVEDYIAVRKEDSPGYLANAFCAKHGFGVEQKKKLTSKISQFMERVLLEERESDNFPLCNGKEAEEVGDEGMEEIQEKLAKLSAERHVPQCLSQMKERLEEKTLRIDFTSIKKLVINLPRRLHHVEANIPTNIKIKSKVIGNSCKTITDESSSEILKSSPRTPPKLSADTSVSKECKRSISEFQPNKRQRLSSRVMSICESCKKYSTAVDSRDSRTPQNQYERIYQMGIAQKAIRRKQIQERQEERIAEELKHVTFHPKLTHSSHKPAKSFQDRSKHYQAIAQQRLEISKQKAITKAKEGCTFRPAIGVR
eukprot:TRINITY_DN14396_c0_g2_i1.p1 TRINITY_DN14396_c0_g2~~TRINITY_DN14396_c0_g2_i1.p1  ORF type:complete len:337 (-),score=86.67 TRINITY_DN14396_c0_g2_i1:699-1709(-)